MNISKLAKTILADILQLDNPVVVAGVVGVIVSVTGVFGIDVGPYATALSAVLAAAGAIASAIKKAVGTFTVVKKSSVAKLGPGA